MKQLRNGRDALSVKQYEEAKQQLHLILDQKEIFWRQGSKQLWLQSGDRNTRYFHSACNTRRRLNRIHKFKNDTGEWVNWQNGLQDLIQNYYKELFSSAQTSCDEVVRCVSTKISSEQNIDLLQEISEAKVRAAIFQMHPDKAPGPDGMTPAFFQKHWKIIGADVVQMVRDFFSSWRYSMWFE